MTVRRVRESSSADVHSRVDPSHPHLTGDVVGVREAQSTFTIISDKASSIKKHRSPLQVIPPGIGPGSLAALLPLGMRWHSILGCAG